MTKTEREREKKARLHSFHFGAPEPFSRKRRFATACFSRKGEKEGSRRKESSSGSRNQVLKIQLPFKKTRDTIQKQFSLSPIS